MANAFNVSPESVGTHGTNEACLREILVQSVYKDDFQFKFDNILSRLNKEVDDEKTIKQGIVT